MNEFNLAIAVYTCPSVSERLKRHISGVAELCVAQSWEELDDVIRTKSISAVFLDPGAAGSAEIGPALALISKYRSVYFILYTLMNAANVNVVLQLGQSGVKEVLAQGIDDSYGALRAKVKSLECTAFARTTFTALLPSLLRLPSSVVEAVENAFQSPQNYATTRDLAREAGIPLSRLYRDFEIAELRPPRDFLIAAKVWHGYSYLRASTDSIRDIAIKLGYAQTRVFVSHVLLVFGTLPSALRADMGEARARQIVSRWLSNANDPTSRNKSQHELG